MCSAIIVNASMVINGLSVESGVCVCAGYCRLQCGLVGTGCASL